jgi:hypothetical protein
LRPFLTRWAVPLDNENALYIGVAHLNSYNNPHGELRPEMFGEELIPFIGQTGDRPYQERQREPGDYDAVVSQGRIVNRSAEHLGTTDKGLVLIRQLLSNAIKAVANGAKPALANSKTVDGKVRTYAHESVVKLPSTDSLSDPVALAEFGHRAALAYLDTDDLPADERELEVAKRICGLLINA